MYLIGTQKWVTEVLMIDAVAPLSALLHNAMDQQCTDNNQYDDDIFQVIDVYDRYDCLLI